MLIEMREDLEMLLDLTWNNKTDETRLFVFSDSFYE